LIASSRAVSYTGLQWGSRLQRSCITREWHTWLPDQIRTLHKIAIGPKAQLAVVAIMMDIEIG